ncbi:MAG TPA: hypothetical protein VFQ35_10935, partial [Polyangiaceae bacterium]|nr:hypothetical protein [Polyangiaceae bacterium]
MDDTLRHCSGCSGILPGRARFCPSCGRDMQAEDQHPPRAVEPRRESARRGSGEFEQLPPLRIAPGTRISVYRVEDVIGEGGMGVVYRAYDEALDRVVALKCLHTNLAGDADIRRRFEREARVLRSYSHPGVVSVYDFV